MFNKSGQKNKSKSMQDDLDTCLEYSEKIKVQDLHQRVAGDKIYIKVYCVPKGGEKK